MMLVNLPIPACRWIIPMTLLFLSLSVYAQNTATKPVIWKLRDTVSLGGFRPEVLGNPLKSSGDDKITGIRFNGVNDGLIIPVNPVKGLSKFTIEVLFRQEAGVSAPRFIHFQDSSKNRGTFETRVTPDSTWYLDTFLSSGKTSDHLTLIDSTKQHPCGRWYWVALVYDGDTMSSYVNGIEQGKGPVKFASNDAGKISVGVRQNKVNWFRGTISEIRFHAVALNSRQLQHFKQ